MADLVEFELVSPERLLMSEGVEMVVVPGAEGDFGVLPGHAPMISTIRTGVIAIYVDGAVSRRIFVAGGFAEVTQERCTILAEQAVLLEDVDRAAVDARIKEAELDLRDAESDEDRARAEAQIAVDRALLAHTDRAAA